MGRGVLSIFALLLLAFCHGETIRERTINEQSDDDTQVPVFDIDLGADPAIRWKEPILLYKDKIIPIMNEVITHIPPAVLDVLLYVADSVETFWPPNVEIRQELAGIAALLEVDVGILLGLNLHYELEPWLTSTNTDHRMGCTSLLAMHDTRTADKTFSGSSVSILHGRNLDYGIPNLQDITIRVRYLSGGNVVFEGVTFVGYIGMGTGVKKGAFSLSQDARAYRGTKWNQVLSAIFRGGRSMAFLMREVFETSPDFDTAAERLQHTQLITYSYFILGGVRQNEGMVISRSRSKADDVWKMASPERWYLVQTNDDHWLPPQDSRRDTANALMQHYHQTNVTAGDIWAVMNTHPVLNRGTIFTAVMEAATGYFRVKIQYQAESQSFVLASLNLEEEM